jgi:hypothetical protein
MGLFDDLLEEDNIQTTPKRNGLFDDLLEEDDLTSNQQPVVDDYFTPRPLKTQQEEREIGTLEGISNAAKNAFDSSRQAMDVVGGVTPEEAQNIAKIEFDKKSRKLAPGYDEYQKAEGMDAVLAFAKNPIEVTSNIVAEGLAGSLPALGAGLAAGGVGAAAGSVVPVLGTAAGFTAGQVAGTFAGSLATEYGGKVLEELQGEGMDISDPNSIQKFFANEELLGKARDKALTRGVPVAAFDALSAGIGGKLGRVFGTKAIEEGGKVIGKQFATKTGEALTELGVQAGLGGGGEVAGALAVGEPIEGKAVFGEIIGEVGPGSVQVLTGKIADQRAMAKAKEDAKVKAASELSTTLEENNAPLTANVVTTKTATSIEQDKLAAQLDEELSIQEAAAAAAQPPTTDATQEIIQPEGVRQEPQDRTKVGATTEAGVSDSILDATRSEEERQVARDIVSELQAVANNTATGEQIVRLSMEGLVDVRRGQAIINEDGEGILAQAQAQLPKLTPEARAAEVEAAQVPKTRDELVSELEKREAGKDRLQELTSAGERLGEEGQILDDILGIPPNSKESENLSNQEKVTRLTPEQRIEYGNRLNSLVSQRLTIATAPVEATPVTPTPSEPIIGEEPQVSPIVGEQVAETTPVEQVAETQIAEEPIISEKPQTSEIVGSETPAIVEQEQVAPAETNLIETPDQRYSRLLLEAEPFSQPGNNYNRNIASSYERLKAGIESGSTLNEPRAEELEIRLRKVNPTPVVTTAPVTEQVAPAEAPAPEVAPEPEAMQMAFDDANPNIVTNQEDLINTFTPQEKAEYTELEDLRYKSVAMQGSEKGYKPFKLNKKQKDRRVELEQKFIDREQRAGAASQVKFNVTASRPVKASLVENFNIALPEGYTKQGELYVYQPTVSETITEPAAQPTQATQPEGIAVGTRIKLGKSPQTYIVEEVIPQTANDKKFGEQYYSVRSERKNRDGEYDVQAVLRKDMKLVGGKRARKMAVQIEGQAIVDADMGGRSQADLTPQEIDQLENGRKIRVFRAMQIIDGKLYPPMSALVGGKLRKPTEIGTWEKAEERPDLLDKKGKFILQKGNKATVPAAYNPYFHTSSSPLNDQFSSAYKRDNLVTVEVEIPASELTSGYKAEGAKDAVGEVSWNAGPVSSKLPEGKKRKVFLSRYAKVVRIVPDSEVAGIISNLLQGTNLSIPENTVTPSLKSELEKKGVIVTLKPADTRMMAGDIREQQEAVTPIPEANRYTYEEAVRLVDSYFDKEGIPEGIVIVNNTTDPDLEMKAGYFVDRGQIVINLAYIAKGENLSDIISHELGHFIFSDPQFQADFKAFWDLMTPEEQADADRIINQFYNKETGAIQMEEKQVRAFMQLIQDSKAMPKWKQLLDSIKRWINEKLGTNFLVTDRGALSVLAAAHKRFKSGERIIREIDSGVLKMAAEPRREKVASKERGDIITTPKGIIEQSKAVIRNKFFDGTEVSDERTLQAWNYIEQFLDIESGASNELAGIVNDVVDQETNSKARMGAGLLHTELGNYASKLAEQGDATMLPYVIRRINRMRLDNLAGDISEYARGMRARQELEINGFNTLKKERDAKVERTAATLFGTDRPSKDQVKIVQDAINAVEDETIGNPEDVAAEIEKVEKRTGRKVIKAIEKKVKESTEPKKEELLISFENLDADKKIKGITLKYNPQKVNVAKNIQNLIIGKMVDYRKTLVNQGAGGLESTFWQTMSNLENKPGPLGELDQAQNNELARIVKNTLIKLGLQGEPDNTKMTDIEKVASILNENKLSDEKRLEADQRIVQEIERRRQGELASGSSPEAVNAKYDVILDAWNEAMSRQLNMPISDNMLQRLLKSEIKQRNTQIGELINENDGRVTEQVKNDIVDSIIRRIYGVSKEFETGIEMDEDYSNLQSYLKQTINNMYATAIQKKNAAYAKRQAERSLKNNVDAQAQSIINQLSTELSDTPSFSPQIENKVKVIVQQDLRQNPDMGRKQPWTSQLTAKLIDAGVDETQAQTISELTWRQHEIKKMDRDLKELKTAAEKGSLAVIIDRIKTTPLEKQQEPNWMQGVIREYLVDAGLSGNAADTAARLYESVISERLAEAKQKAFETTLNKSAPWNNYLSRNAQLGKNALKRIQDAIRTGVLDPTQNVESIIAKENGWSGFTKEQFQRIVQLDNVISNPESDEVTKAEAMSELNGIIVKAKIPVRFKDAIGAYYVGQALMGIPTVTVNIASPIGFSVRNLITDIGSYAFTEPSRIPMAFETFLDSMKSWYNQTSYAFRNQIYLNDVVEYLNGQNVLRELFDKGKAQWARGEYANGMANMLVGMTQITGRVLSALDQGSISMLENQNITRYAMEAMKQRNIPQSKRKEIANMILDTRRRTYAENIASGMAKDRAGVLADMAVRSELISALAPEGIDFKDVLTSAINDSLQSVGRNKVINTKGIEAENKRLSDAGMLSYLPIKFLEDIASGASSGNPLMQVFSKMLYGFALVPARVFHTTAWYSPYGFIRLGIDKYKKNKGEESPYAMSLQTDLQYKQRLTESIAGSIVMLGLAALAGSSTDDEEEKKFRIVITGNGPSYSADRQYFDSWNKKWKPYSIHIVMGDTIIPINIGRGGEALFFPIMLAGALDDWNIKKKLNLTKKSPEDLNFAVEALGSAFFALAQRGPYAAFTKPLFDASKEGKITEELVGQAGFFGKTFVPILGASVARNISDFINDPVDRSSLEGAIYANTPVIGPWMGAKALNALGQPVRADDWGDKLYKLGAPVVFSFPKNTPENELNELILKKGSGPSIPTRSNAQKRFGDVMTDKEFETYVREYGRVVSDKMFKNRKKLENMSVKNYDDELQRYVTGYSIDGIKITGASDMAVRAVKKMRTQ